MTAKAKALALRVLPDQLEHGETDANLDDIIFRRCVTAWPSSKARLVLAALLRIGWSIKRQRGSHRVLERDEEHA